MSADNAYLSYDNLALIVRVGATPFIPFRSDSLPGGAGVWRRLFHFLRYRREKCLTHYHRRSNVQSAFSRMKRKSGDAVRAKTDAGGHAERGAGENPLPQRLLLHLGVVRVENRPDALDGEAPAGRRWVARLAEVPDAVSNSPYVSGPSTS